MATEGIQLVRRQWQFGAVAGCVGSAVLLLVGLWTAFSFAMGVFAVVLGSFAAGRYTFRQRAPSGLQAAIGLIVAMVMRWMVVVVVLLAAFLVTAVQPLWVVVGIVFGLVISFIAVLTFKRR